MMKKKVNHRRLRTSGPSQTTQKVLNKKYNTIKLGSGSKPSGTKVANDSGWRIERYPSKSGGKTTASHNTPSGKVVARGGGRGRVTKTAGTPVRRGPSANANARAHEAVAKARARKDSKGKAGAGAKAAKPTKTDGGMGRYAGRSGAKPAKSKPVKASPKAAPKAKPAKSKAATPKRSTQYGRRAAAKGFMKSAPKRTRGKKRGLSK